MAFSIKIDAGFWEDPRFLNLEAELGTQRAIGACVASWRLAKTYWLKTKAGIPENVWKRHKFPEGLFEHGLAVRENGSVYVKGTKENVGEYEKAVESGKRGAEIKKQKKPNEIAKNEQGSLPGSLEGSLKQPSQLSPSPSPSQKQEELLKAAAAAEHPLLAIWNKNRGTLPAAKGLSSGRKRTADARWKEKPSTEYWTEVVIRMSNSDFLCGRKNDPFSKHHSWRADIDFLLKPDTHVRVSEGRYDNRENATAGSLSLSLE